jgi:hypothetical protein
MMIFRQCQKSLAFAATKRGECRISWQFQPGEINFDLDFVLSRAASNPVKIKIMPQFCFSICVLVTVQIRVLHNPNVTFSKFSGSIGHPLAALDPATFLRAAQIPSQIET